MDGWMPPSTLSSGKCELEVRLKGENDLLSSMSRENRREWRCGSDNVSLPYYFNSLPLSHCTMIPEARAMVFALPFPLPLALLLSISMPLPSQLARMVAPFSANCSAEPPMFVSFSESFGSSSCGRHKRQNKLD